jgi:hypothetical protein
MKTKCRNLAIENLQNHLIFECLKSFNFSFWRSFANNNNNKRWRVYNLVLFSLEPIHATFLLLSQDLVFRRFGAVVWQDLGTVVLGFVHQEQKKKKKKKKRNQKERVQEKES